MRAFTDKLAHLGWSDSTVQIAERWPDPARPAQLRSYAFELAQIPCDVIIVNGERTLAAVRETGTGTPIVIAGTDDPSIFGPSLARPSANVTGFLESQADATESFAKSISLLKEAAAQLTGVALLISNNQSGKDKLVSAFERAASLNDLTPRILSASSPNEVAEAIRFAAGEQRTGLLVPRDAVLTRSKQLIIDLVNSLSLPSIFSDRLYPESGGLMSYGSNKIILYELAAGYVDRLLKGETPAQLPVQQAQTYELVLNLGTARRAGLSLPHALLAAADTVIE